jgi:hypothetical protein
MTGRLWNMTLRGREALEDYVENGTQRKTSCAEHIVYDSGGLVLITQTYADVIISEGNPSRGS